MRISSRECTRMPRSAFAADQGRRVFRCECAPAPHARRRDPAGQKDEVRRHAGHHAASAASRLPLGGQEIELQHFVHDGGGMPLLRVRIRERAGSPSSRSIRRRPPHGARRCCAGARRRRRCRGRASRDRRSVDGTHATDRPIRACGRRERCQCESAMIDIVYDVAGGSVAPDYASALLEAIVDGAAVVRLATRSAGVHPLTGRAPHTASCSWRGAPSWCCGSPQREPPTARRSRGRSLAVGEHVLEVGSAGRASAPECDAARAAGGQRDAGRARLPGRGRGGARGARRRQSVHLRRAASASRRAPARGLRCRCTSSPPRTRFGCRHSGIGGDRGLGWGHLRPGEDDHDGESETTTERSDNGIHDRRTGTGSGCRGLPARSGPARRNLRGDRRGRGHHADRPALGGDPLSPRRVPGERAYPELPGNC